MAFPETVKDAAFKRSGGRCECTRTTHTNHRGRCATSVSRTSGEYHHTKPVNQGGADTLDNCELLCITCHKQTPSYGG